jgi:methionyl-tRNA formyltransferase
MELPPCRVRSHRPARPVHPTRASWASRAPGTLVGTPDGGLALVTTDGALELHALQPAGGRPMSAPELLRGRPALLGSVVVDT